jgi:hypothetical protein
VKNVVDNINNNNLSNNGHDSCSLLTNNPSARAETPAKPIESRECSKTITPASSVPVVSERRVVGVNNSDNDHKRQHSSSDYNDDNYYYYYYC